MSSSLQGSLGYQGEEFAVSWLIKKKVVICERNWMCSVGEIDIIGIQGEYLIFFEVKTRRTLEKGHPLEALTKKKQHQIIRCAKIYLKKYPKLNFFPRFDALAVFWNETQPTIEWVPHAFGEY